MGKVRDDLLPESLRAAQATITRLEAENARLVRERDNLQAALTARSKTLLKARNLFINIHDELEDEGDRIYFGSTNDADDFKDAVRELDGWAWETVIKEGELTDIYEVSLKAHEDLRNAEARAVAAEEKLAEAVKLLESWAAKNDLTGYWENTDDFLASLEPQTPEGA